MLPNAFIGWTHAPADDELSAALGDARPLWDRLLAELALPVVEWHSYSVKAGWSLRLKEGKRTIVWVSPCQGSLRVAFALGESAMNAARNAGLPAHVQKILEEAPRYAEGAAVRLEVTSKRDLAIVKTLAAAKKGITGAARKAAPVK